MWLKFPGFRRYFVDFHLVFFVADVFCNVSTERSGHADHFDIVERVEMGQMASMFFNKGNVLIPPPALMRV